MKHYPASKSGGKPRMGSDNQKAIAGLKSVRPQISTSGMKGVKAGEGRKRT